MPLRIILVHPGHALSTAWIFDGLESAFEELGITVLPVRLDNLISTASDFIDTKQEQFEGHQGAGLYHWKLHLAEQLAITRIMECIVDNGDVMLNICGKLWSPQNLNLLNLIPFPKVIQLTESPYEDETQKYLLEFHDFAFTNDKSSAGLLSEYRPTAYLRHAYDPDVFRYIELDRRQQFDYSFIGTPFGNRKPIIEACRQLPLKGYLFDKVVDEEDCEPGKTKIIYIPQESACRVYNQTKVNLNIHRTEKYYDRGEHIDAGSAYSLGPRAYEIAGCRAFQLCDSTRPELKEVFGETVATYDQPESVAETVAYWADDAREVRRREMAHASWEIARGQTYYHRSVQLVEQLACWYNRPEWAEGLQND